MLYLYLKGYIMKRKSGNRIANFVKYNRKKLDLNQNDLAKKAGVGLRFIRDLEQGKETLRMDKVNRVLELFGHEASPGTTKIIDPYDIMLNHMSGDVEIMLKNKTGIRGTILESYLKNGEIRSWKVLPLNYKADYKKEKNERLIRFIDNDELETINNIST
jgi:y4mF family transcriptional regulator